VERKQKRAQTILYSTEREWYQRSHEGPAANERKASLRENEFEIGIAKVLPERRKTKVTQKRDAKERIRNENDAAGKHTFERGAEAAFGCCCSATYGSSLEICKEQLTRS
jgi:hypothetical protein